MRTSIESQSQQFRDKCRSWGRRLPAITWSLCAQLERVAADEYIMTTATIAGSTRTVSVNDATPRLSVVPATLTAPAVRYAVACPSCGARSQLLTRHSTERGDPDAAVAIVRFRCINQMARAHRTPTDTELHTLLSQPRLDRPARRVRTGL